MLLFLDSVDNTGMMLFSVTSVILIYMIMTVFCYVVADLLF